MRKMRKMRKERARGMVGGWDGMVKGEVTEEVTHSTVLP